MPERSKPQPGPPGMNANKFRAELEKRMPGYSWTVHRQIEKNDGVLEATGIQASGMNRLSTLSVERRENDDGSVRYIAMSSGYGARAPWAATNESDTMAKALRGLQSHYESWVRHYAALAEALERGRKPARGEV